MSSQEDRIVDAFDEYMGSIVEPWVEHGFCEDDVLSVVFSLADKMAESKVLPPFPDDTAKTKDLGAWLVSAHDANFAKYVNEILDQVGLEDEEPDAG